MLDKTSDITRYDLLAEVATGSANKARVLFLVHLFTLPLPYFFHVIYKFTESTFDPAYFNSEYLQLYYESSHFLTLNIVLNVLVGWYLSRKEKDAGFYEVYSSLSFNVHAFYICFFFGVFTSPAILMPLLLLGFSSIVLRPTVLALNILVFLSMFFVVGYGYLNNWFPYIPTLVSIALYDESIRVILVSGIAIHCIVQFVLFFSLVHAITQSTQDKHTHFSRVSESLTRYISPQIYQTILSEEDVELQVSSQGTVKFLTTFVSDIKDFTRITENMESEALESLLNEYLQSMASIALEAGGTIDKYIGDSVVVFFGDPISQGKKQDAKSCVEMALKMQRRLAELNQRWMGLGLVEPLAIRMGIHSGEFVVGNYGTEVLVDYSALGKNLGITKQIEQDCLPGEVLVSEATWAFLDGAYEGRESVSAAHSSYALNPFTEIHVDPADILHQARGFLERHGFNGLDQEEQIALVNAAVNGGASE